MIKKKKKQKHIIVPLVEFLKVTLELLRQVSKMLESRGYHLMDNASHHQRESKTLLECM